MLQAIDLHHSTALYTLHYTLQSTDSGVVWTLDSHSHWSVVTLSDSQSQWLVKLVGLVELYYF